jgi:PAS domain S-box-containing protein
MLKFPSNRSQILILSAMLIFILLSVALTSITLVFMNRSYAAMEEYIRGVDLARDVQTRMEKQFNSWKTAMLEGDEFSSYSTSIQNDLFNLKLICASSEDLSGDIVSLIDEHVKVTRIYVAHLVTLENSAFRDSKKVILDTHGMDRSLLEALEHIVAKIENSADEQIKKVRYTQARRIHVSMIVISLMTLLMGVGIALKLARIHMELEERVRERTTDLVKSKNELEEANRSIRLSEERYRLVVEGSDDIIFTMDESLHFTGANRAMKNHLKVSQKEVQGLSLMDLLHDSQEGPDTSKSIIKEKLERFREETKSAGFKAHLKTARMLEPREFLVRLEKIDAEGKLEIVGKAETATQDSLLPFFESERTVYRIRNSLIAADDISYRITGNLCRYAEKKEIDTIRIALREIIINAIEHGNLEISFDEKSEALMNDSYFQFIARRQSDSACAERTVKIECSIDERRAVFIISDQGKGFDHSKITADFMERNNREMTAHGRGIAMARNVFDRIKYNDRGNQVLLIRNLQRGL